MNFLIVVIVSVVLATGVFNTETKVGEENKKTEIIVKETIEKKPAEEEVNLKELAQVEAEAQAKAAAEAQAKAEAEAQAQAKAEAEAQAQAKAEAEAEAQAQAKAEAQEEIKEIENSKDSGTNYLRLALYLFGSILVISTGAYFYFRQRDNSSSRSATRTPDSSRRDFRKEVDVKSQEEQPIEEEVKSAPQEEKPIEEEVKSEPQEERTPEDEKK